MKWMTTKDGHVSERYIDGILAFREICSEQI